MRSKLRRSSRTLDILYCTARPYMPHGFYYGSTRTAATILSELAAQGHRCRALAMLRPEDLHLAPDAAEAVYHRFAGVDVTTATSEKTYSSFLLDALFDRHDRPDAVWTELEWSGNILRLCRLSQTPSLLWIKDLGGAMDLAPQAAPLAERIVCSTQLARRHAEEFYRRRVSLVPEAIDASLCTATSVAPRYITLINPVPQKGSDLFLKLVAANPQWKFLAVHGWTSGRPGDRPPGLRGATPPNLTIWPRQDDMRRVYAKTAVLLVPSLWEEAFGRVIVEGMMNGIPVVASAVGGIPEVIGAAGLVVRDPNNVRAWTAAVDRALRDGALRRRLSHEGPHRARRFSAPTAARRMLSELNAAIAAAQVDP